MKQILAYIILKMKYYLKILSKILLNYVNFQHLTVFFLDTVILHKLTTTALIDTHSFGLVCPRKMNNNVK